MNHLHQPVIQVEPGANTLEQFARRELEKYLRRLFGVEPVVATDSRNIDVETPRFLLGRNTDLHVCQALGVMPALSPQGYVIRRVSPNAIVLAGGSSASTAWAVYELLEHFGVRFLLHGDVLPRDAGPFGLPQIDLVREPVQSLRSWRVFNDLPTSPALWSLKQQKQFMNQLFKLRFNAVNCCLWPHHPVIDYQVRGIRRRTAEVCFGQKIPINADNIGREHLWPGDVLTNPELLQARTYEEKVSAGKELIHGIFDHARSLGMHTSLNYFPFEYPNEFRPVLQKPTTHSIQLGDQTCAERGDLENAGHVELAATVFRAMLQEYGGDVDELYLALPEHPQSGDTYRSAWQTLSEKYKLEPSFSAEAMVDRARGNHLTAGGADRAVNDIKSTICMLNFLDRFLDRTGLLREADEQHVRVGLALGQGCLEIMPALDRILWPGAMVTAQLGYTSSRAVRCLTEMAQLDARSVPAALVVTLQDDNIGSLPQVATDKVHILLQEMHAQGWRGFFTRFWPLGDLDPVAAYLSRASWNTSVTPGEVYIDHFTHVIGPRSMPDCCRVMRLLEDMTVILDLHYLGLLFPVVGIMKQYVTPRPMDEALYHIRAILEQCRMLLKRIEPLDEGPPERAKHLAYWISRLTFGIELLNEIEHLHAMAMQLRGAQPGDAARATEARQFLSRALTAGEAALRATADNVRDDADRGTLAAYFHFAVREVRQLGEQMIDDIINSPLQVSVTTAAKSKAREKTPLAAANRT